MNELNDDIIIHTISNFLTFKDLQMFCYLNKKISTICKIYKNIIAKKILQNIEIHVDINDSVMILRCLKYYPKITFYKTQNENLKLSIENGHIEIMKFLIKKHCNISAYNLLKLSAKYKHFEITKYLLEYYNNYKTTTDCMYYNARYGNLYIIKYIIQKNPDIITSDAFITSVYYGHLDIVQFLLGQDSELLEYEGLLVSVENDHIDIVKYLIEQGADIHYNNNEALKLSIKENNLEIIDYLIGKGAYI
jgi:ankyrin repeat protein